MESLKLDIGCATKCRTGFTPVDRCNGDEAFPLSIKKQPIPDNSVDEIVASHVLEHFSQHETAFVIKEWVRVLKPGGRIRIAVPDFNYAIKHPEHPHFEGWILGGQTDENDYHKALFNRTKLEGLMLSAGLELISEWVSDIQDCAALPVSLNLQGYKPKETPQPKIVCALSMPRLGFNDTWGCITAALFPWDIPIRRYTGAWWERSLQNMLDDFINEGVEYAVCIDYDSMFTAPQFNSLLDAITKDKNMDAVCAMQPMRGSGAVLCTPTERVNGSNTVMADTSKPMQVDTAHFGLTILRLSALKNIQKPWFVNMPGEGGSWRREAKGLIDADIYFWNQWKAAGRTLYMLPWVSIGHLECLVSKIDPKTGKNVHCYPISWIEKNLNINVEREATS